MAVLEASLVMRRVFSGTRPSDGCSILAGRLDDKCLPVLFWPSILIDWPFACHAPFGGLAGACIDRLSITSSCKHPKDSILTCGKKCLLDGLMNMDAASGLFRSFVSAAADFLTCIELGRGKQDTNAFF